MTDHPESKCLRRKIAFLGITIPSKFRAATQRIRFLSLLLGVFSICSNTKVAESPTKTRGKGMEELVLSRSFPTFRSSERRERMPHEIKTFFPLCFLFFFKKKI